MASCWNQNLTQCVSSFTQVGTSTSRSRSTDCVTLSTPFQISFRSKGAGSRISLTGRLSTFRLPRIVAQAASGSSSADGRKESRWDPLLANSDVGCPVPPEQQPVNEYSDLSEAIFFSWATSGPFNLGVRLAAIGLFFTVAVGFPIASATFDIEKQALQCVLSAIGGGLFPVIFATSRLYLGWQYVGARLSSATVEYEETGWYDGQVWVKTPELLARDRLLASYRVKPVLKRLQRTLIGLAAATGVIITLVTFLPDYKPKPEPRPFFFDDVEVESPHFVNIIRAEEKAYYDPESVELYEDAEEDAKEASAGASPSVADLYRRLHSAPAVEEGEPSPSKTVVTPASYLAQGYGFEYLLADEADEDSLFSREDAEDIAGLLSGKANVTIIAYRRRVVVNSEDSFTPIEGTEDLTVVGAGVSSAAKTSSKVRISDHLGTGGDGQLQVVKSLKPEADVP